MRLAILIGRKHGKEKLTALGPAGDPHMLNIQFKRLVENPGQLAELQLWTSGQGEIKKKRFAAAHRQSAGQSSKPNDLEPTAKPSKLADNLEPASLPFGPEGQPENSRSA